MSRQTTATFRTQNYIYPFQSLRLGFILKIFLKLRKIAPRYSYKIHSYIKKECIGPLRSPGKFPRPFIRPSKQIRRLLASLLYNGQASFPTLLPFSGAGKFSLSTHPMPYPKFFTHNLSIKRHKVAFMRM